MRLLCCDPGLANLGLVMFDGKRIVSTRTLRSPSGGPVPQFAACVLRGEQLARDINAAVETMGRPDLIICEGYKDIPGPLRGARSRWTTPLLIGQIVATLRELTETGEIVWQDPELVMTRYAQAVRLWALGQTGIVAGDSVLRNEHLRSAAAHGLFYLDTHKAVRS